MSLTPDDIKSIGEIVEARLQAFFGRVVYFLVLAAVVSYSIHDEFGTSLIVSAWVGLMTTAAAANLFFDVMARISHVDIWDDFYGDPESRWARQWFVFKYYSEPFVTLGIVGVGASAFYLWVTGQFALVAVWYSKFIEWIF